jgi:hypothetical protein
MTSPPLISFLAALFATLKKCRLVCWIMDLNPDEAVAAGWLSEKSAVAKVLQRMLIYALRSAERIVVMDRFMKERIERKGVASAVVEVIPPWSHDNHLSYDAQGRSRFRRLHGLEDKFVVMYSGNHSPCHPLGTLLNAALELSDASDIAFCFVGGGSEFSRVRQFAADHALRNVVCLPYQPLDQLSASLSAADLHVVVLGAPFVGIVHPCKVYNILTLGIPFLYIGPEPSHITDMPGAGEPWRYHAPHGDTKAVVAQIQLARAKATPGNAMETAVAQKFSHRVLTRRMIAAVEGGSLLAAEAAREGAAAL